VTSKYTFPLVFSPGRSGQGGGEGRGNQCWFTPETLGRRGRGSELGVGGQHKRRHADGDEVTPGVTTIAAESLNDRLIRRGLRSPAEAVRRCRCSPARLSDTHRAAVDPHLDIRTIGLSPECSRSDDVSDGSDSPMPMSSICSIRGSTGWCGQHDSGMPTASRPPVNVVALVWPAE
jgi:hypothetical protein